GSSQNNPANEANLRNDLDQLSTLIDITITTDSNTGKVTVLAGGQLPLVLGDQSFQLSANPSGAPGSQVSSSASGHSPLSFSGQLGALLHTRNGPISQLLGSSATPGSLNTLA